MEELVLPPTDTRVLLERSPLARVPVESFELFPTAQDAVEFVPPTDPVERAQHQLGWFWSMYAPMASGLLAATGSVPDWLAGLTRVLREAAGLVGQEPVCTTEGDALDTVRALAVAMVSLLRTLSTAEVELPSEVAERLRAYDEANEIRRHGWLRSATVVWSTLSDRQAGTLRSAGAMLTCRA